MFKLKKMLKNLIIFAIKRYFIKFNINFKRLTLIKKEKLLVRKRARIIFISNLKIWDKRFKILIKILKRFKVLYNLEVWDK